jgi:hypothetical protein
MVMRYSFPGNVAKPMMRKAILTINPAMGPADPISNRTFLDGMDDRTLITAPNVPKG